MPLKTPLRFALIGASLAMMVAMAIVAREPLAYGRNHITANQRIVVLTATIAGAIVFAIAAAVALRKKPEQTERIDRIARPLLLAFALPGMFLRWRPPELAFLSFVSIFGLVLEKLLTVSLSELRDGFDKLHSPTWTGRIGRGLLALGVGYYLYRVGTSTIVVHQRLETSISDLGEFNNLFFNALRGHPFRSPAMVDLTTDWSALKMHAELVLYLLLPFYAIAPRAETLLVLQTMFIGGSAILVFAFAERRLGSIAASAFALAFLCFPVVQRPNFYDFHFTPVGMFFVLAAFVALDREKKILFVVLSIAVAACREDVAMGFAIACMALAIWGIQRRFTLSVALALGAYSLVMRTLVMPALGESPLDTIYAALKAPEFGGLKAIVMTLVTNPLFVWAHVANSEKLLYVLHFAAPLLFLWLRVPRFMAAAIPGGLFTLLVTERPPLFQSSFQYVYLWVPYVVLASVCVIEMFADRIRQLAVTFAILVCGLALDAQYGVLLGGYQILGGFAHKTVAHEGRSLRRLQDVRAMVAKIPPEASVAATEQVGPHFSSRLNLFSLKSTLGGADYLVVLDPHVRAERPLVVRAIKAGKYGLVERFDQLMLFQRDAPTDRNPEALEVLGNDASPE